MEHAPIPARIAIISAMVTNMKTHYVTRWAEANMTKNDNAGWKNKSKVHQNR